MNRRQMIAGVAGALGAPFVKDAGSGQKIKGVGVLRFPCREGAGRQARELSHLICEGCVLCLPGEKDSYGSYVWDFRIEGGDPGQVKIERQGG